MKRFEFYFCFAERDELRKDIEQLCMQQAGPSYLAVATRMHFQRYYLFIYLLFLLLLLSSSSFLTDCIRINALPGQLVWSRKLKI